MQSLTEIWQARELLMNLTMRELKGKYKRTVMGQLWSLANPLAQMLIYTVVFAFVIRVKPDVGDPSGVDVFALWIMCGLLPWTFFTNVVTGGMGSITGNENIIKKVYFPRVVLIYSNTLAFLYSWLIEMAVLVVVIIFFGSKPLLFLPLLLVMMLLLAVFATGVALFLSISNVYFRDVQHFVGIIFQVWFYATPIVYPAKMVAEQVYNHNLVWNGASLYDLYLLNPLARFGMGFRDVLYNNQVPSIQNWLYMFFWAIFALVIGYYTFKKNEGNLAEAL